TSARSAAARIGRSWTCPNRTRLRSRGPRLVGSRTTRGRRRGRSPARAESRHDGLRTICEGPEPQAKELRHSFGALDRELTPPQATDQVVTCNVFEGRPLDIAAASDLVLAPRMKSTAGRRGPDRWGAARYR